MYFRIQLLTLLLATVAMVATSQEAHLPRRDKSAIEKCASFIEGAVSAVHQRWELLPLKTLCHPNIGKYFDCMLANVYKSNYLVDIHMRSVTDFSRAREAIKTLCRKTPKLNEETRFCNVTLGKCGSSFRPALGSIIKDSPAFCKLRQNRRCAFNEFAKCDLKRTMLWAKYESECQSVGCLVSDPTIQLIPSYGPELKCYSSVNVDDIETTDYVQIYARYCDQFNYTEVSACVEETLSNVTSEDLWEDKESYTNKARQFVTDRQKLCRKMATLPSRKCFNPSYKPDASICQNMLFTPPGPATYSVSNYVTLYAHCVWLTYLPCNLNLGFLIYKNLITYV